MDRRPLPYRAMPRLARPRQAVPRREPSHLTLIKAFMNVNVKPRPFPKRKPSPVMAQATASAETFVRFIVTKAVEQLERKRDAYSIATSKFPGDARLRTVIRATAEPPADLSNTPALAVMGTDYIESLQPISAAAQIFRASRLML